MGPAEFEAIGSRNPHPDRFLKNEKPHPSLKNPLDTRAPYRVKGRHENETKDN